MSNSVYLSGPSVTINDPALPIAADWKTLATQEFLRSGITIANPIELDLTGFVKDITDVSVFSSVKHSLSLIDRADSMLVNLFQLSESATMEMFYAHRQGKQVVVVGNEPFSPWVMSHSEARFYKLKEGLDYLINQVSRFDTLSWSTQFEYYLKKQSEQYPPEGQMDFEYYGGSVPILVLAPHSTSYFMDANLYPSESYTGSLAVLLNKLTGCHSLITSYCVAADPIYYLNTMYVNCLTQLLKKLNFKLVVILNGIEEWNNHNSVILTSWNKKSLIDKIEYFNLLVSMLKIKDIKEIGYDSKELISIPTKTLSHLIFEDFSLPTIRLEIHKKYRLPKLHPDLYLNMQTALAQFLMLVGSH